MNIPNELEKIERLRQALNEMLPMKEKYKTELDKKFRLEFNFNSNHMEGNTLTYGETELALIFDRTNGNHTVREYQEMKAHDVALKLIQDWAADRERPLTELDVKYLNEIVLVEPFWKDAITLDGQKISRLIKVGDYKEYPNSVRLSNGEMFEYASVLDTPIQMGDLIQWFRNEVQKSELHPVALAALLHYKFVRIHPFDDGNGRISRLLMNYVLLKNDLPPVVIKSADKTNYLSALNSADTGDLDSFIKYISQQLIWSLELSIKAAKGESIEEPDDLEKEIAAWKKEIASKTVEAQHRNDGLIHELYINGIKELFEQFENKHKQFYELFREATFYTSYTENIDDANLKFRSSMSEQRMESIKWLSAQIDKYALSPQYDNFRHIGIIVMFSEYKYNVANPFEVSSGLDFNFEPYKYFVEQRGDFKVEGMKIEKKYGEFLDKKEQEQIITECVRSMFLKIKKESEKGKG